MPFIQVSFIDVPSPEQQRRLITSLTDAVVADFDVPPEAVHVVLTPVDPSRWGHAGTPLSERPNG